jgi:NitT/TauT family transport system substrate-binding protein
MERSEGRRASRRGRLGAVLSLLIIAGAAAAGAAGADRTLVAQAGGAGGRAGSTRTALRLGLSVPYINYLPAYVAKDHTFEAEGLDVQLVAFRGSSELAQALASDSVDVGAASVSTVVNLVAAGHAVKVFYGGVYGSNWDWLAAAPIGRFQDLRGKRVGVSAPGSLVDWFTRHALRRHGLDPDRDVQLVTVGGSPFAYQALRAGRIDAAMLAPPFKWQAAAAGFRVIGTAATEVSPEWPTVVLFAKEAFLAAQADRTRALLRAYVRAIARARADREATVDTIVRWLKLDRGDAERSYDEIIPALNERGVLPARGMGVFWELAQTVGEVSEPWPESRYLDRRFIDTFDVWAPR